MARLKDILFAVLLAFPLSCSCHYYYDENKTSNIPAVPEISLNSDFLVHKKGCLIMFYLPTYQQWVNQDISSSFLKVEKSILTFEKRQTAEAGGHRNTHLGRSSSMVHAPHWLRDVLPVPARLGSPLQAGALEVHPLQPQQALPTHSPECLQVNLAPPLGSLPPRHQMQRSTAAPASRREEI